MINLIPKEEKKRMVRSFYYKLAILFFVVAGSIGLIAFIVLLPSYFISLTRENILDAKLELQKIEPVPLPDQQTLKVIEDLDNKINLIERAQSAKFAVSEKVINTVVLNKVSGIKIADIIYENDPAKGKKIAVGGNAPSREILLLFRRALEDDIAFQQVDLPISNFVKGSNIKFYLNLIPR